MVEQTKFALTPKALEKAKELRDKSYEGQHLRVGVKGAGCSGLSYSLEFTKSVHPLADELIELDGLTVVIDRKSMFFLKGAEFDYEEGLRGKGFTFKNPDRKST